MNIRWTAAPAASAVCAARLRKELPLNVVEIDAASNNGVENIRDIREQVQYPPTDGRYRVYIIDEVHMLSIGAFNALFKDAGRTAVLRYIYLGDDGDSTRSRSRSCPGARDMISSGSRSIPSRDGWRS